MAGEWKETSLAAVMDVKHGFAFPGENIRDEPPGDILLTPGNFAIGGGFKGDKFKYFDGEVPEDFVLKEGELVLTMTDLSKQADTLGYPAIIPNPRSQRFLHNQRLGKVLIKRGAELDRGFLFYLLRTAEYRNEVLASATGTTVKHTSPGRILAHKASIPPLAEQKAIAAVLGALDDKIELNRRMNATLEAMARALFQSWFVDFDPVRAKLDGRKPIGLDETTAALFPDSFEESSLGHIPSGWRVLKVGEFIERLSVGQKYEQKTVSPIGKVPVLDQGKSGVIGFHNSEPGVSATLEIPVGVFANHTCYMRLITFPFSAIQNVLPFVGSGVSTFWAYYASEGRLSFSEYKGHWPDFVIQESVVPPCELTDAFGRLAKPLVAQIRNNEEQSRTLATLRDTLLPKLLSGELSTTANLLASTKS